MRVNVKGLKSAALAGLTVYFPKTKNYDVVIWAKLLKFTYDYNTKIKR